MIQSGFESRLALGLFVLLFGGGAIWITVDSFRMREELMSLKTMPDSFALNNLDLKVWNLTILNMASGLGGIAANTSAVSEVSQKECNCPLSSTSSSSQADLHTQVILQPGVPEPTCVPDCVMYSQSGEDLEVLNYMMDRYRVKEKKPNATIFPYVGPKFVMLEIGGLDGKLFSNSYFFEHNLRWRVILFEPSRKSFQALQENRPRAVTLNLAVCEEDGVVEFIESNAVRAVSGIARDMSPTFMSFWHGADHRSGQETYYNVTCGTVTKYLQLLGVPEVDLFSLDVEGSELKVLKGLDFSMIRVHYLVIEMDGGDLEKEKSIRTIMKENSFKLVMKVGEGRNELYENMEWSRS